MSGVWVEQPRDGGSAVWGCHACNQGEWCTDHTRALLEARTHARTHGTHHVTILGRQHGPQPKHDDRIAALHAEGHTHAAIARLVGITAAGVTKALHRIRTSA